MKKRETITICRRPRMAGLSAAAARLGVSRTQLREVSDLKAGQFQVGQHVMLAITGDCCYHRKVFAEYVVTKIERIDRFGGRDRVTFERVEKRPAKEGGAK